MRGTNLACVTFVVVAGVKDWEEGRVPSRIRQKERDPEGFSIGEVTTTLRVWSVVDGAFKETLRPSWSRHPFVRQNGKKPFRPVLIDYPVFQFSTDTTSNRLMPVRKVLSRRVATPTNPRESKRMYFTAVYISPLPGQQN